MGRKVHPIGFRIGIIRDWSARWYADKDYARFLQEDLAIRRAIQAKYAEAGISQVDIERQASRVSVTVYTAWPGIVIGRGGQRADEVRRHLEKLIGKRIQLNIREIRQTELDAYLVARSVAERLERRIAYRRVMKQTVARTMQAGARGIRVICSGRLAGAEIARRHKAHQGQVPLHTLRADIDYGFTEARTTFGRIGVKVWIYKGDILPEIPEEEVEVEEVPAVLPASASSRQKSAPAAEPVTEAGAEAVVAQKSEEETASLETAATPAEPVAEAGAKAAVAQKPKKKTASLETAATPAEPVAEAGAKAVVAQKPEKKTTRTRVTRKTKLAPSTEPEAEKPATDSTTPAEAPAPPAAKEEKPATEEVGEKDVTA